MKIRDIQSHIDLLEEDLDLEPKIVQEEIAEATWEIARQLAIMNAGNETGDDQ